MKPTRKHFLSFVIATALVGLIACDAALGLSDYRDRDTNIPDATSSDALMSSWDGATIASDATAPHTEAGGDAGDAVQLVVLWQSGLPVAGAKVRFGSGTPVSTDADGKATLESAPATYDLDVVLSDGNARSFRGLSTRTPVVHFGGSAQSAPLIYTMSGTDVDGGAESLRIFAGTDESQGGGALLKTVSGTSNTVWIGDNKAPVKTTFIAMLGTGGPANLTSVRGRPSIATAMMQPNTAATQTFDYQDATQGTLSGTIENNGTVGSLEAVLHDPLLPAVGVRYVYGAPPSQTTFSIPTYAYPTATYDVRVGWASAPGEGLHSTLFNLQPTSTALMLRFTATAVHVASPATGATNVTLATMFSWTPADGVYELEIDCTNYYLVLALAGTSSPIPDLSALGLPFPAADSCTWDISSFPDGHLDDFVGPPTARARILFATQSVATAKFQTQ